MNYRKCDNCGNQVNNDDNICQYCGNSLNQDISNINNQENGTKQKKVPNFLKIGIYMIIGFVLGITPFLLKEIKQFNKNNQENNTIVEDIETENKTDNVIDNQQDEEIINDEQEIDTDIKEEIPKEEQKQDNKINKNENSSSNNSNTTDNKNEEIIEELPSEKEENSRDDETINQEIENRILVIYNNKLLYNDGSEIENIENLINYPILISNISNIKETFINKFSLVQENILKKISKIEYVPNDIDSNRFLLYMKDSSLVYISLYKIEKINKYDLIYNSIADKLTIDKYAIIYLDNGDYIELKYKKNVKIIIER